MSTIISTKSPKKFICEVCTITCAKKTEWTRHLNTRKHKINESGEIDNQKYICECGKIYKERTGLWRHTKTCNKEQKNKNIAEPEITENIIITDTINDVDFKKIILDVIKSNSELIKQNQDLHKQMIDMCKSGNNTVNSHNNHSNNKTFNLQFFLNEQCKDAMNIMDFVDTFQLQFDDLERIGEVGYVEGISNLIIDKLNSMDIYKRPIHCSDAKREIMHIKDKGVWEKDNENNDKLRLAIKHITKKNIDLIGAWTEKYPGVRDSDHRLNDKFNEIIMEAMGGKNNKTMKEGEAKIIKKISKMVLIDKNM